MFIVYVVGDYFWGVPYFQFLSRSIANPLEVFIETVYMLKTPDNAKTSVSIHKLIN